MATAALTAQPLHPETKRLLDLATWTADPAVPVLFGAIKALIPVGEALSELSADRPSINRCCGDEIGHLSTRFEEVGRVNVIVARTYGSGTIGLIWDELDALRARWIEAQLRAEGLRSDMGDYERWYDRKVALEELAPTVDVAWAQFCRGEL